MIHIQYSYSIHIVFLARLFEEKSQAIIVTPASASGSVKL